MDMYDYKLCEICEGSGVVEYLSNYDGYHYHGEEPITDACVCVWCDGKGHIEEDIE